MPVGFTRDTFKIALNMGLDLSSCRMEFTWGIILTINRRAGERSSGTMIRCTRESFWLDSSMGRADGPPKTKLMLENGNRTNHRGWALLLRMSRDMKER